MLAILLVVALWGAIFSLSFTIAELLAKPKNWKKPAIIFCICILVGVGVLIAFSAIESSEYTEYVKEKTFDLLPIQDGSGIGFYVHVSKNNKGEDEYTYFINRNGKPELMHGTSYETLLSDMSCLHANVLEKTYYENSTINPTLYRILMIYSPKKEIKEYHIIVPEGTILYEG